MLDGRGSALLRGFDVGRYSLRDAAIAFFGIGSHIGQARSQNAKAISSAMCATATSWGRAAG